MVALIFLPVFKFLMYTLDQFVLFNMFSLSLMAVVFDLEMPVALLAGLTALILGAVLSRVKLLLHNANALPARSVMLPVCNIRV